MSTAENKPESINSITGKITLKGTGKGIPDLLVVIYDLDPGTKPDELITGLVKSIAEASGSASPIKPITGGANNPVNSLGFLGDRIGSVLTSQDGTFKITYNNKEFQILNESEKRPDLFLMILGPEEPQKSIADNIIYYSSEIRQNAGRNEQYFIQLTEKLFLEKEIDIPKGDAIVDLDN